MASEWISAAKRLPNKEDIKRNGGDDFFVTAIYGINGIPDKCTFLCNFNIHNNTWESCDNEIVIYWRYKPSPAVFDSETYFKAE